MIEKYIPDWANYASAYVDPMSPTRSALTIFSGGEDGERQAVPIEQADIEPLFKELYKSNDWRAVRSLTKAGHFRAVRTNKMVQHGYGERRAGVVIGNGTIAYSQGEDDETKTFDENFEW